MAECRFCVHIKLKLIVSFSIIAYLFSFAVSKGQNFYDHQLEYALQDLPLHIWNLWPEKINYI